MGLPISQLVIATNENDILHRFWQTGTYEKLQSKEDNTPAGGVKETMSPAMDILISSKIGTPRPCSRLRISLGNFERLLWFFAYDVYGAGAESLQNKRQIAGRQVKEWQATLKSEARISVDQKVLDVARAEFSSERVSDVETLATIQDVYQWVTVDPPSTIPYVLDPHSAISVTATVRLAKPSSRFHHVALSTAHPAKFSYAVGKALSGEKGFNFKDIFPSQLSDLDGLPRRVVHVQSKDGLDGIRKIIKEEVEKESSTKAASS